MMSFALDRSSVQDASDLLDSLDSTGDRFTEELLTRNLLESFLEFRDGNYSKVVELLEPMRYDLTHIGGSGAQRDVINLMLISAAMKSGQNKDRKLARVLITERDAFKGHPTQLTINLRNKLNE
jgi:hypothetical protein